ncbi:LamG-like jellyroll fold domain-containing protein [Aegicerativicinus sediminis]|uniref:LamG-like jellyroll fold domain-containing protein n=1 Tax=Aegicerativicinus sediminis TaxID=2893202 RepID=UPI001E61DDAF|nr:LamG-like jellyroll fold domain-containing protein [Aegicerativicinus sediminis]
MKKNYLFLLVVLLFIAIGNSSTSPLEQNPKIIPLDASLVGVIDNDTKQQLSNSESVSASGVFEITKNNLATPLVAIALCQNITIYLDINGNATITAAQVDNGSTGNGLSIDVSDFTCADLGLNSVTLTVTDSNDTTSDSCVSTVTVVDNLPPSLTGTAYAGTTGTDACSADAGTAAAFDPALAIQGYTDNCGGAVSATLTGTNVTGTDDAWTVEYTFTVSDANGNDLPGQTYSNTGGDATPPSLTGTAYAGTTGTDACSADAGTAAAFDPALAIQGYTDNCGGAVSATLTGTNVTGTDDAWTVEYTFTVSDANGNDLPGQTYSNTGGDATPPSLTGTAYAGTTGTDACSADAGTAAAFDPALAIQGYTDNCGGAVSATLTGTNVTGTDDAWTVEYTFTVSDANGNDLPGQTYSNTGGDATPPSLTGTAYAGTTGTDACSADAGTAAAFDPALAIQGYTDNCGGAVSATLTGTNVTGTDDAWTVEYTFTVSDANGNDLPGQTYSNTGGDATPPSLTGTAYAGTTGTDACSADAGTAAAFDPALAIQGYTDNCGGAVSATLTGTNVTGTDDAWTVEYTFTVSDANGNDLPGQTYSNTGGDATPPSLTGTAYAGTTGTDACSADAGTAAAFDPALAIQGYTDNCGGAVSATLTGTNVTGTDDAWTVEYTFTVSDANGNDLPGQTYSNTGGDATPPSLTGTAYAGTTGTDACSADAGTAAAFDPALAIQGYTDNCGGAVSATLTGTNVTGTDDAWTVEYTFTVSDANGNDLPGQTYSNTGGDATPPSLTGTAYAGTTGTDACSADAGTAAAFDPALAIQGYTDNCGGAVSATLTGTNVTGTDDAWTVEYTFTVSDANGNDLPGQTYSNTGGDATPPSLTGTAYAGTTGTDACSADAGTAAAFDPALAIQGYTDNCGGAVSATLTGTNVTGTDDAWTVEYTFTVSDANGNDLPGQTYSNTGGDATPPSLTGTAYAGTTGTDACSADAGTAAAFDPALAIQGYTDNCGGAVSATLTGTNVTGTDDAWTVEYTFTVSDANGNDLPGQTYSNTGGDATPPTAICQDISIQLDSSGNASITPDQINNGSTDNCGTVNLVSVLPSTFDCDDIGDNEVTLTINDGNGNESTCTATVTVTDASQNANVSISTDQTVFCSNVPVDFTSTVSNAGSNLYYRWYVDDVDGNGYELALDGIDVDEFPLPTPVTNNTKVKLTITSNTFACEAESNVVTITTNTPAVPSVVAQVSTNTICEGESINLSNISAQTLNTGTNPEFEWFKVVGSKDDKLDGDPSNDDDISIATVNSFVYGDDLTENLQDGDIFYLVVTPGPSVQCPDPLLAISNNIQITVNPLPVFDSAVLDGSVCADSQTSIDLNTLAISPGNTVTFHSTLSDAEDGTNALSDSNVSPTSETTYYVRTETIEGCFITEDILISIDALPIVDAGEDIEICLGESFELTTKSDTDGPNLSYFNSLNDAENNTNELTGGNTNVSPTSTAEYWVRSSYGTCYNIDSFIITVNPLLPQSVVIDQSSPMDICDGIEVSFTATPTNGGTSPSYQWYVGDPEDGTANDVAVGTNSSTLDISTLADGNEVYVVMTPDSDICTNGQAVTSSNSVVVNEFIAPATPPIPTGETSLCPPVTNRVYTIGPADPNIQSYTWSYSGTGFTITGQGTNTISIDVSGNSTSGILSVTANNVCGTSTSSTLDITVGADAQADAGPDQYICASTVSVPLSGYVGGGAINPNKNSHWWWDDNNAGGSFPNAGNHGTHVNGPYTLPDDVQPGDVIKIDIQTIDPGGDCGGAFDTMYIYILDDDVTISSVDSEICENTGTTIEIRNGEPNSTVTYEIDNGGTPTTATIPLDSNGEANIDTGDLSETTTYTLVDVAWNSDLNCTQSLTGSAIVTVTPIPFISGLADVTICSDDTVQLNAQFSDTNVISSGVWSTNSGPGSFSDVTSPTAIYTPDPGDLGKQNVTLTFTTTDSNSPCGEVSASMVVTINPKATVANLTPQTICEGEIASLSTSVGGAAIANSGEWTTDGDGAFTNISNSGVNVSADYTPGSGDITAGIVNLTYTTNDPDGAEACEAASTTMVLTINPAATINGVQDQTACQDETITLLGSFGGSATSGTWTKLTASGTLTGDQYTPNQADANAGTVTLQYTTNDPDGTGPCIAVSQIMTLTIIDKVVITTQPQNVGVCAGEYAELSVVAVGDEPLSYQWYKGDVADGFSDDVAVGSNSNVLAINSASLSDAGAYYVVVSGNSGLCSVKTSNEVTLNVNQTISITTQPTDIEVCLGGGTNDVSVTIIASGSIGTFDLYKVGIGTPLDSGLTGTINSGITTLDYTFNDVDDTNDPGDYYFVINGPSSICPPLQSDNFNLTVSPNPEAEFSYSQEFYCGSITSIQVTNAPDSGGTYSIVSSNGTNYATIDTNTGEITVSFDGNEEVKYDITYTIPAEAGPNGCLGDLHTETISIQPFLDPSDYEIVGTSTIGNSGTGSGVVVCYDDPDVTLDLIGNINSQFILRWEILAPGSTWQPISGTEGLTSYAVGDIPDSRAYRIVFDFDTSSATGACGLQYSDVAYVAVVSPEDLEPEPVQAAPTEYCLGGSSTLSSTINYGGDQLNYSGGFDQGQLNTNDWSSWLVDDDLGKLSASGNCAFCPNNWSVTNPDKTYYGITYNNDNPNPYEDRGKFGITAGYYNTTGTGDKHPIIYEAYGDIFPDDTYDTDYNGFTNKDLRVTTLETPIFNLNGIDDPMFEYLESFSLTGAMTSCETDENSGQYEAAPPSAAIIEISTDGGTTYQPFLDSEFVTQNPESGHNHRTSSIIVGSGDTSNTVNSGTASYTDFNTVQIDLNAYRLYDNLRIRFTMVRNCGSSWAIEGMSLPGNDGTAFVEWRNQYGITVEPITNTNQVVATPQTPGLQDYNVRAVVDGCENPNSVEIVPLTVYYAQAGAARAADPINCGGGINLKAYDNFKSPYQNYKELVDNGDWDLIPVEEKFGLIDFDENDGAGDGSWDLSDSSDPYAYYDAVNDTYYKDYRPTNILGEWTISSGPANTGYDWVNLSAQDLQDLGVVSDKNNPEALVNGPAGNYTFVWTILDTDGSTLCSDTVEVFLNSCSTLDFDGFNDYVRYGDDFDFIDSPLFQTNPRQFTIELWIKNHENPTFSTQTLYSKRNATDLAAGGYDLVLEGGNLKFRWDNNLNSLTAGTIGTNRWYHTAVSFDGSNYKLYVDGILMATSGGNLPTSTDGNEKFLLGAMDRPNPDAPTNHFKGWMDELRIWNVALNHRQIRHMMNQQIHDNGGVMGDEIPLNIPNVANNGVLSWSNLVSYYQMNQLTGGDVANGYLYPNNGSGIDGKLVNIITVQDETAPLPYYTKQNGDWYNINTWAHPDVWDAPNSAGINGNQIDWNIVKIYHDVDLNEDDPNSSDSDNITTVLGLSAIEDLDNPGPVGNVTVFREGSPYNETNAGRGLWITHYLKLDGTMDLIGESQLVQKKYYLHYPNNLHGPIVTDVLDPSNILGDQFSESTLDTSSEGHATKVRYGNTNMYNYNYFAFPVSKINTNANNVNSSIQDVFYDGINYDAGNPPVSITWIGGYDAFGTYPNLQKPRYWLNIYDNYGWNADEWLDYYQWQQITENTAFKIGLGHTMKGSGPDGTNGQHYYTYKGKPNNAEIAVDLGFQNLMVVGNPYLSAIDADEFIFDNIQTEYGGNPDTTGSMWGTLFFWEHYIDNDSHWLSLYQGGYATYNLTGGNDAATYNSNLISGDGTPNKTPGRYIPVGQGFFVYSDWVNGSSDVDFVDFRNDQRVFFPEQEGTTSDNTSQFLRVSNKNNSIDNDTNDNIIQRIRLKFTNEKNYIRPLLLGFIPNNKADDSFNNAYDAPSLGINESDLLWSIDDQTYSTQGVGEFEVTKRYPLYLVVGKTQKLKISIEKFENFEVIPEVYIHDVLNDTYFDIKDKDLQIVLEAGEYNDRFYVTFTKDQKKNEKIDNSNVESVIVNFLSDSHEIYVQMPEDVYAKQIYLINIIGQTVKDWNSTNLPNMVNEFRIPVKQAASGNYIIKLVTNKGIINKKVIID